MNAGAWLQLSCLALLGCRPAAAPPVPPAECGNFSVQAVVATVEDQPDAMVLEEADGLKHLRLTYQKGNRAVWRSPAFFAPSGSCLVARNPASQAVIWAVENQLGGLNRKDGQVVFETALQTWLDKPDPARQQLQVVGDWILLHEYAGAFEAFKVHSGEPAWQAAYDLDCSGLTLLDGKLFMGGLDGGWQLVKPESGKVVVRIGPKVEGLALPHGQEWVSKGPWAVAAATRDSSPVAVVVNNASKPSARVFPLAGKKSAPSPRLARIVTSRSGATMVWPATGVFAMDLGTGLIRTLLYWVRGTATALEVLDDQLLVLVQGENGKSWLESHSWPDGKSKWRCPLPDHVEARLLLGGRSGLRVAWIDARGDQMQMGNVSLEDGGLLPLRSIALDSRVPVGSRTIKVVDPEPGSASSALQVAGHAYLVDLKSGKVTADAAVGP